MTGGDEVPDSTPAPAARSSRDAILRMLQPGQFVRGRHRYQLHHCIGTGAFGAVWASRCVEPDTDAADVPPEAVAIKFFVTSGGDEGVAFIRRELAALLSMRSEFIPRVYDWSVNPRLSFFVMDYFRHGTLADVFEREGGLGDDETWLLMVDVLCALNVAHRSGVLHLDIKPANIMRAGDGGYQLLDFGISQASQVIDPAVTAVGAGSVGYQAPEQRRLELDALDLRTDLWALGATAWAARTGYDLRKHVDKLNLAAKGKETSLPPLSTECLELSPALEEIVMSLLCEDPRERPGGAADVLEWINVASGLSVDEPAPMRGRPAHGPEEVKTLLDAMLDPLWTELCRRPEIARHISCFDAGELLCLEGEGAHEAFVLLKGSVDVTIGDATIERADREGTFIGELSTLTGTERAASVRARETTWVCGFNSAEFERLLAAHPAVSLRLVKLMAERLHRARR